MNFKHKNVLVYGLSVSGESVAKLLLKNKANVFLFDDNKEILKNKTIKNAYILNVLNKNLIAQFDFLVVSPSIEKDNIYLKMSNELNIKIYSEVEFAALFCKDFVAVTGTNGKTTTVQLITALLKKKKAVACGNIGYPLSRAVLENKKSVKVVEVSSFMLENAQTFSPKVATILNIEPDHLIRHKSFNEYKNVKLNILKNLTAKDYVVVNIDKKLHTQTESMMVTYSYNHLADVYVNNNAIYLHDQKIICFNELNLKGKHNIYNVMCAICFAYIYKIKPMEIRSVLLNFKGEKFRIEHVAKINGVNFINDSKSTNVASTLACVESIKGAIVLLLGGSNKGLDYSILFKKLSKRVKEVVVFGEIANQLLLNNENKFKLSKFENLNKAFNYAVKISKPNDSIVLSPASASYDQYENYIERGKEFNNLIKEYENEITN